MSGRLDQSLDSIIDSQKKAKRAVRRNKPRAAPVGGVKKAVRPVKSAVKPATGPAPRAPRNSKVVVSGLPHDVNTTQVKEYFGKCVGPIKRVSLYYDQNGQSKGVADIIFTKPDSAAKAAKEQSGIKIDGRPIKVEVVLDAAHAPEPAPTKSLADRVAANPKAQPKSATAVKPSTKNKKAAEKKQPRRGKNPRPKAKTAEELDAEMTDYWAGNNAPAAAGAAPGAAVAAPAAGDDAMEEIS